MPDAPIEPRVEAETIWTDEELLVWGGTNLDQPEPVLLRDGAAFAYDSQTWRPIPPAPIEGRRNASVVWTGSEMIVWGGYHYSPQRNLGDGAAYDPRTNSWRRIAKAPLAPRMYHVAVWTGDRMLVSAGWVHEGPFFDDGAGYDPATDTWSLLPSPTFSGADSFELSAIWTGDEMLVTGVTEGAAYKPSTRTWRKLPPWPLREEGLLHEAVLTGRELLVLSGCCSEGTKETGGAVYKPQTNSWRLLPRYRIGALPGLVLSTGEEVMLLGTDVTARGRDARKLFAASFDPETGSWHPFALAPMEYLHDSTAIWTGRSALIWSGVEPHELRPRLVEFEPAARD